MVRVSNQVMGFQCHRPLLSAAVALSQSLIRHIVAPSPEQYVLSTLCFSSIHHPWAYLPFLWLQELV